MNKNIKKNSSTSHEIAWRKTDKFPDQTKYKITRIQKVKTKINFFYLILPFFMITIFSIWWFWSIKEVEIQGNNHLSVQEIINSAGIYKNSSWIFYNKEKAKNITKNPWVHSAKISKIFPNTVKIEIEERKPFAIFRDKNREFVLSRDGIILPNASKTNLPIIQGFGVSRKQEALNAIESLRSYNVKLIMYTPSGLLVETDSKQIWSGNIASILKHSEVMQYPNQKIYIYPWGVSIKNE